MEKFEENHIKIANYLDNKMNPAEEELFMLQLGNDAVLRQQYEDELMVNTLLQQDEVKNLQEKKPTPVISLWKRYRTIAIFLLILFSGAIIYIVLNRKDAEEKKIVKSGPVTKIDSPVKKEQPNPQKNIADEIFNQFYKPYSGENDPVELSNYYDDYKKHTYEKVISAKETDYQTMGADEKNELLKQYMHLYKGLSWLEKNETAKAIQQFDAVKSTLKNKSPFYEAQWYGVLSRLKKNESDKAAETAKQIVKTNSPHKSEAEKLLQEIRHKK